VNLCARVAASAAPSEIRITLPAFQELPNAARVGCSILPPQDAKGLPEPVTLMRVAWRRHYQTRPLSVLLVETGEEIRFPDKQTITFGRLRDTSGQMANDIVLALPDIQQTLQISRWHFELRRRPEGWTLRSLTDKSTEVDGQPLDRGAEAPIRVGTLARVAQVLTLEFRGEPTVSDALSSAHDETILPHDVDCH
jgi:hypothetical protein